MKQAVVLIHGIGEQKPMSTLRSFVGAVLDPLQDGEDAYWSKPDRMSESFELRRLQARGRPTTHFYEYYWAYNVEGTTTWQVLAWLLSLIRRTGKNVPEASRSLWIVARTMTGLLAVLTAMGVLSRMRDWFITQKVFGIIWVLVSAIALVLHFILVYYIGDAARYCSANPQNIRLRQTIRSQGLSLLRTLHESGEYDRIIVVGHSLGSVIGYDLISRLWQEYNEKYPGLQNNPETQAAIRTAMKEKASPQPVLRNVISQVGEALSDKSSKEDIEKFQKAQIDLWSELRGMGNPWLISDFITLGSPLVHAMLLLAESEDDFESRKRQREFPTCPPQHDAKGYAYSDPQPVEVGEGKKFTPLFLHHAAPFAMTRWTNLYFPAFFGLFGDFVGGRLRPVLGNGIKDLRVRTRSWGGLAQYTLKAHTSYWNASDTEPPDTTSGDCELSLIALKRALALSDLRKYRIRHESKIDGTDGEEE